MDWQGQGLKQRGRWDVVNVGCRKSGVSLHRKKPDTLFIEFGINDAYLDYKTSVAKARANLENMIKRVLAAKADTEIS